MRDSTMLIVVDGAKALSKAVRELFGAADEDRIGHRPIDRHAKVA